MKRTSLILLSLLVIIICSCAHTNQNIDKPKVYKPRVLQQTVNLPEWCWNFPKTQNSVIGFSYNSSNRDEMIEAAKQSAAINLSRNKQSYAISKFAMESTDYSDYSSDERAQFEYNVSANMELLKKLHKNLKLQKEAYFHNYFIGLFSLNNISVNEAEQTFQSNNPPSWYNPQLAESNQSIIACGYSSSSNLQFAFEEAMDIARIKIGSFLEKEVQAMTVTTYSSGKKVISIETEEMVQDIILSQAFIAAQSMDSTQRYEVWVKMVTDYGEVKSIRE